MPHVKLEIDAIRRPQAEIIGDKTTLVLKECNSVRYLPIIVSSEQADVLSAELQCLPIEDRAVLGEFLSDIKASPSDVICITIHFDNDVYSAKVLLYLHDQPVETKCPIGKALALAYRTQAPILINSEIMEKHSLAPREEWVWGASDAVIKAGRC